MCFTLTFTEIAYLRSSEYDFTYVVLVECNEELLSRKALGHNAATMQRTSTTTTHFASMEIRAVVALSIQNGVYR